MSNTPRLQEKYKSEVIKQMTEKFGYKSVMQVPKLLKIVLNQGVKGAVADKKLVNNAVDEMTIISGQKAVATYSKKDIANFKLRSGMPIGAKVTLRSNQMYEFLDRFVSVSLPRVRDFRGINNKGFENYRKPASSGSRYGLGCLEHIKRAGAWVTSQQLR